MTIQTIPGHTKPYHAVPSHAILLTIPNCNIPYLSILCQCIPYHTKPYQCLNTLQFNPVNVLQITLQIKAQCKLFALQCSSDQSSAKPYYAVWRIILGCQSFARPWYFQYQQCRMSKETLWNLPGILWLNKFKYTGYIALKYLQIQIQTQVRIQKQLLLQIQCYDWTSTNTLDTLHCNISKYNRLTLKPPFNWTASTHCFLFTPD